MGRSPGTTVFVGNISYETTEEQLREVFSEVGNVISFRLMYNHETGLTKGFGFCKYEDKETAMSARRNLNGTMLNGRSLRVDFTKSDKKSINELSQDLDSEPHLAVLSGDLKTPPHPPILSSIASANPSTTTMSLPEIHRTMLHLKQAVVQNPSELRDLLTSQPRLAHAVLQGQIMLGMMPLPIPPQPPARPPCLPVQRPSMQHPPQMLPPQISPHWHAPLQPPRMLNVALPCPDSSVSPGLDYGPLPLLMDAAGMPQMHIKQMPPSRGQIRVPPQTGQGVSPLGPLGPPPVVPPQPLVDEEEAILRKVMTMSQQEINALAPEYRGYVLELKEIVRREKHDMGSAPGMTGGLGKRWMRLGPREMQIGGGDIERPRKVRRRTLSMTERSGDCSEYRNSSDGVDSGLATE